MFSVWFPWTPRSVTGTAGETEQRKTSGQVCLFKLLSPCENQVQIVFVNIFELKHNTLK
jgi:hypothetical protein